MDKQPKAGAISLYKKRGQTPLETLNSLREKYPEYKDEILSYAGRLDPMAEGVLVVLVGKETNSPENRKKYLDVDKEYEVEILLGIETDTYDILGKITHIFYDASQDTALVSDRDIEKKLKTYVGTFEQEYPPYSSKAVQGKSLFEWARKGKLAEIEIPKKSVTIYDIEFVNSSTLAGEEILKKVSEDILKVSGDFRQQEIIDIWQKNLGDVKNSTKLFQVITIKMHCSSGTYARALAHDFGIGIGQRALAYSIKRLKIGSFSAENCLLV